jgi:hypothetical protein
MLLSVLEASFTLRCNMCTLTIVVHCKGAWWSRCELCGLGAVWVCELYLFGWAGTFVPLSKKYILNH